MNQDIRRQASQDFGSLILSHLSDRINYFLYISLVSDIVVRALQNVRSSILSTQLRKMRLRELICAANCDKSKN